MHQRCPLLCCRPRHHVAAAFCSRRLPRCPKGAAQGRVHPLWEMLREAGRQEPVPQSHWCVHTILTFADAPQWFLDVHVPKHLLLD